MASLESFTVRSQYDMNQGVQKCCCHLKALVCYRKRNSSLSYLLEELGELKETRKGSYKQKN